MQSIRQDAGALLDMATMNLVWSDELLGAAQRSGTSISENDGEARCATLQMHDLTLPNEIAI